jgi:nucleoside 2-deoxyribosyltransferase
MERRVTFSRDIEILEECAAVLAVPIDRDPGSLVELGWALALSKPAVVFDPRGENNNTMVVAGSASYSVDLDDCLNELFRILGQPSPYQA